MQFKPLFEALLPDFQGKLEFEVPLSKIVYYQIGGEASVLATPKTFHDLEKLHELIQKYSIPFFVLGWGSNLLFSDQGFKGLVIRMKSLFTEVEEIDGLVLKLGASLGASSLLRTAGLKGYGGLQALTGIPGSVGGMVVMNAGTHVGEMKDILVRTEYVNLKKTGPLVVQTRVHESKDFSYRKNHFLANGDIVTHAYVKFTQEAPEQVQATIKALYDRRKETQPVDYPSCGSVFVNPEGYKAWEVIDRLGLRGHRIGNAQIAEKHSNFIINLGGARSEEVRALIQLIQARAKAELNVQMETEVKILP